jgi:hypothetical protein
MFEKHPRGGRGDATEVWNMTGLFSIDWEFHNPN